MAGKSIQDKKIGGVFDDLRANLLHVLQSEQSYRAPHKFEPDSSSQLSSSEILAFIPGQSFEVPGPGVQSTQTIPNYGRG